MVQGFGNTFAALNMARILRSIAELLKEEATNLLLPCPSSSRTNTTDAEELR